MLCNVKFCPFVHNVPNDHHRTANICNTITCTDMIAALENSSIIYTPTCKVLIITGFNFFCINLCYRALTSSDRVTEPSHHQTQQPGKDHHPRDHCREERQRETGKNLGERHRGMGGDKHWWSNQNGREEGSVVHCHRRHSSSTLSHLNREREREPFEMSLK